MSEISNIIGYTLGDNDSELRFFGEVYCEIENQLYNYVEGTSIDRNVFNTVLNETNAAFDSDENLIDAEANILLMFIQEHFVDESSFWKEKQTNYYNSLILLEECLINSTTEHNLSTETKSYLQLLIVWDDIDLIELFGTDGEDYFFRFYYKDRALHEDIYAVDFCTSGLESCRTLCNLFNEIVEYKKQVTLNSNNRHIELESKIEDLIYNDENYNEALNELDVFKGTYDVEDIYSDNTSFYYLHRTLALLKLDEYEKALKVIDSLIDKYPNINDIPPYAYELKGEILMKTNNFLPAINYFAKSEENYKEANYKKDVSALKEESYIKLKEVFLQIPYNQRKLIFIGENIYATNSNEFVVLKKNDLPLNINFPVGHPYINEIYICHPHKQNFYLPLKNTSEELFHDRISEFCWLLQCLGANKLEISSTESNLSDNSLKSKKEVDINFDYRAAGVKVNYQGEELENTLFDGKLQIAKKQIFSPAKSPYLPEDLVWYYSERSWQRLVHQRLNGGIQTHSEVVSSSQFENVSTHELIQVDIELKLLLPKLGVKYSSDNVVSTTSGKKHEWLVTVDFEDKKNLLQLEQTDKEEMSNILNSNNGGFKSNLEKYKEDVMFMLEDDGVIDNSERKILDRKIKKYGLSEVEAKGIENKLLTLNYSENELKYIEELKDLLEDGEITITERKMLDRYALKYSISSETQAKIDSSFII